jgi:hypothetical protein
MGELSKIINEIHRHKGVLLPDDNDLQKFSEELFYGACKHLGVRESKVRQAADEFVLTKYKQVLTYTQKLYLAQPEERQFYFRPLWDDLERLQRKLAGEE